MAFIFPSQVGVPSVVQDPNATPATFSAGMQNWPGFGATHCVITGVEGSTQGNYQFLLTLRNYTYVYVFGERMGDFRVMGLSMAGACNSFTDGMTAAITYYNSNCISNTGTPIILTMGGYATYAFLTGANFSYPDPASRIGRFQYTFKTITDPS